MNPAQKHRSTPNPKEKVMNELDLTKFLRPVTAEEMAAAWVRVEPAVKALRPEDVRPQYGLSLASAAGIALVTVHQIGEHVLAELEARTDYDRQRLAELQDAALAASHLASQARKDVVSARSLGVDSEGHALLVEGQALRQRLGLQLRTLSAAEELPAGVLRSLGVGKSFRSLSGDLDKLTTFIEGSWSGVKGKTFITHAEVERAGVLVGEVQKVMSTWEEAVKDGPARRANLKARTATILMERHDLARVAVAYVRPKRAERDAIAPALMSGRARPRKARGSTLAASGPSAARGASAPGAADVLGAAAPVTAGAPTVAPSASGGTK